MQIRATLDKFSRHDGHFLSYIIATFLQPYVVNHLHHLIKLWGGKDDDRKHHFHQWSQKCTNTICHDYFYKNFFTRLGTFVCERIKCVDEVCQETSWCGGRVTSSFTSNVIQLDSRNC